MAKRIKWTYDKAEDYRGNHTQFMFKVNNSPMIFEWCSFMTFKCFKSMVRKFAQYYDSTEVTIMESDDISLKDHFENPYRMLILERYAEHVADGESPYWFRKELHSGIRAGTRREYKYFNESEVFDVGGNDG